MKPLCCTAQGTYTVFAARGIGKYYIPYNAFVEATTYYASQRAAVQAAVDRAAALVGKDVIDRLRQDR